MNKSEVNQITLQVIKKYNPRYISKSKHFMRKKLRYANMQIHI